MADQHPLLVKAEQIAANLHRFSHPWNPNSELAGTQLGKTVGLQRTGINFIRVPPGKESFVYHLKNTGDEDLVYLAGGENLDIEIAEFPRLKKRMIRREGAIDIYDFADAKPFEP